MRARADTRISPNGPGLATAADHRRKALVARILRFLKLQKASTGYQVPVPELCREFDSSETSVRAALNLLGAHGAVDWCNNRAFVLAAPIVQTLRLQTERCESRWMRAILHARAIGVLEDVCSGDDVAWAIKCSQEYRGGGAVQHGAAGIGGAPFPCDVALSRQFRRQGAFREL
jgi:hypothetical protein